MSGAPPVVFAGLPATRDMYSTWRQFMGIPEAQNALEMYRTLADFARAPADEAWVYRCVTLKAAFAQSVPWRVYVREGKTRIPAEDTNDGAAQDLQGVLDDVNPVSMNGADLKAYTIAARGVWGESYWRKVRGRLGGPPQELYWLRAPDVEPKRGRVWVDAYEYAPAGTAEREVYKPRDIVPFRTINLVDPTRGLSPLSAARLDIATNREATEWTASTLANYGIPAMAWTIPKDAEFTNQDKSLVQRVLRSLRGPKNQGKSAILPKGLEPHVLSLKPQDAEWLAARKVSRMTVCAVQGVPLVLAGDDEKTSVYANLRDAERIFARYMITELDWVADSINGWLVPDFDPSRPGRRRIVVGFDYSQIEALQAPIEDRKRVALQEVERGVRVPNEYRAEFRIGERVEWGDEPLRLSKIVPLPLAGEPPDGSDPELVDDEPEVVAADTGSDTVRRLYRQPAVRAFLDGTGSLEAVAALLEVPPTDNLATGIRRRYTARQLLDGVPSEGFAGLRMEAIP